MCPKGFLGLVDHDDTINNSIQAVGYIYGKYHLLSLFWNSSLKKTLVLQLDVAPF